MQAIDTSKELSMAISSIENLVNGKNGDYVLDAIREFKRNKSLDNFTLLELKHRLNK